jgi:AraC-like DNA-binding protein
MYNHKIPQTSGTVRSMMASPKRALHAGPDDKVYPDTKVAIILRALQGQGVTNSVESPASSGVPQSNLVSINQIIEQYRAILALKSEPWFAFRAGLRFHVSSFGMYGFAILSSTDFRRTIRFAVAYHELATPLADISFREHTELAVWRVVPVANPGVDPALYRFLVELQFGIHLSLHRDVMGSKFAPRELRFTYSPQVDPAAYADAFGYPVTFNQPCNEFVFDSAWLNGVPALGDEASYSELLKLCDERLANLECRIGLLGKVRSAMLIDMTQAPTLSTVARRLHQSPRTMRRKLQEKGATFTALISELRRTLAVQYLRDTNLSIDDIAHAIGLRDVRNFRRSYRRWTGQAASDFRKAFRAPSP